MRRIQFLRLPPSEAVRVPRFLTFLLADAILKLMNAALWRVENE